MAFLIEFRKDLLDQIIGMHDKLIGQLFNRSERQQKTEFQNSGRAVNEKVRLYAKVGKALIEARASQRDWQQAIESVLPWEQFIATVVEVEKLAHPERFKGRLPQPHSLPKAVWINKPDDPAAHKPGQPQEEKLLQ